ncbi:MAG: bifunctional folylpolyglutamate synthase/dihydrofolate synthase [Peptococcaceae bacterium]|jgi:dihydrofolate synthase/folylpolyglutamate synthase|nr:bifunctional folylpolyglutamate synthase/dihydrofolate synthase [Peptococcaceae bacterium]
MDYDAAIAYLQELTKFGFNFGLGRISELLHRLDDPHLKLRVAHVGGTNGKGSTCAFTSSLLREAGYRVGTFTSPHLHSYTERYVINGRSVSPERLAGLITDLKPHLEAMVAAGFEHPTEFEVSTAAAFVYFLDEQVDFLVLEVGLGGAIDSTNVVNPLVTVVTNVTMDHMDYLGETVAEIAAVKAGIIKEGIPLLTACTGESLDVMTARCRETRSPLYLVGRDLVYTPLGRGLSGQYFHLRGLVGDYRDLFIPILGAHQLPNAALAVGCAELLTGRRLTAEQVRRGLARTSWPARLELIAGAPDILLDIAHNHAGAISLRDALAAYFPGRVPVMVIGMLDDKEWAKVVDELAPLAAAVVVTRPDSPRAANWRQLADYAGKYGEAEAVAEIGQALARARDKAGPRGLVVVTGSLYMVAHARSLVLDGNPRPSAGTN